MQNRILFLINDIRLRREIEGEWFIILIGLLAPKGRSRPFGKSSFFNCYIST